MNKLLPIAELIKQLLETEFKEEAQYSLEYKKDWLTNIPNPKLYKEFWDEISVVYEAITKCSLDDVINNNFNKLIYRKAKMDIWFHEPYNFLCEFDEKQHFNQYRLITLDSGYDDLKVSFDYTHYHELSSKRVSRPGKCGFNRLRNNDMLFPYTLKGEKQNNRTKQRAYRVICQHFFGHIFTEQIIYSI